VVGLVIPLPSAVPSPAFGAGPVVLAAAATVQKRLATTIRIIAMLAIFFMFFTCGCIVFL
jgi:hypothetical protein